MTQLRAILYYIKMRNLQDSCPLIVMRDDPNQLTSWLDDWSDDDCRQVQAMVDRHDAVLKPTPLTAGQARDARRMWARWRDHTNGNAYVLYVQARHYDQKPMRVTAYGKSVHQAVKRYYRGIDNSCNHIWQCTKVVSVYTCANKLTAQAGDLLHGQAQDSAPW